MHMRAAVVDPYLHTIELAEVPDPVPAEDEVLVRVRAAGLNHADLAARAGIYRTGAAADAPPASFVGGAELAGEVLAVGAKVTSWHPGDRVMGRGTGYAELATIAGDRVMAVPDGFSWEEAGGFPSALLTSHDALATNGQLAAGQTVLVHAATSGVGIVAVEMAAALGAATVVATSRSAAKLTVLEEFVTALPCRLVTVDTSAGSFVDPVLNCTDGRGADLIIDHIGASVLEENLAAAKITGRIVQVGRLGGKVATINLDEVARKRLTLVGTTFRTRTAQDRAQVVRECIDSVGTRLVEFRPRVDSTYRLADAMAAQEALARNAHVGKLVLLP
jgi:NADPH:quinone reductase